MTFKNRLRRHISRALRTVGIRQGLEFQVYMWDDATGGLKRSEDVYLLQGDSIYFNLAMFGNRTSVVRLEAIDR